MLFTQSESKRVHVDTPTKCKAPVPFGRIIFPIVHDKDKFINREQSETNQNDENAM